MSNPSVNLGNEIRKKRKEKNLTQVQVAAAASVTERHYQRIESGKSMPSMNTLFSIAEALEVDASALLASVKTRDE